MLTHLLTAKKLINRYILSIYIMLLHEQTVRIAKRFGNGAHIFVPKNWIGEEIVLVRQPRERVRDRILKVLGNYLDSVVGVYLYGSYARGEQDENSDIDLLVITEKRIKIKAVGFEILCLAQKDIESAITLEPVLMYALLSEAVPIINYPLLDELRRAHPLKKGNFKDFYRSCRMIIRVQEDFLKFEKKEYLSSEAVVYSLVLRLRGLFIIHSLISGDTYSHKKFKSWIIRQTGVDFHSAYHAYRYSKRDKKMTFHIKVSDIQKLLAFLKKTLEVLERG